ncbi:MAG: carbamoyl-phosphate synthase (glutamine-hydrolyzing) large subunit [Chlamydiae bacterium]|nr:carbamoyl-phosphate synthase (glutamine-hydrolyzing) large subunit [Chlamydiota bacterium]
MNYKEIKTILLLGSGGLKIGQAGEFDYSGSQAIKALKEEGKKIILVNPNIATIQTNPKLVHQLYLEPLIKSRLIKIIEKERPDGILLSFGGQTALNLGMELEDSGILKKYQVKILGTPIESIRLTEDRQLFKDQLQTIGLKTPTSFSATTVTEALTAAAKIGYPIMMRSGFSLGGLGSGKIADEKSLAIRAKEALSGSPQILIEEYLLGWKEFEYEIVRDSFDNTAAICNMENFDPIGIHTGDSIVVAPSQTLNNKEYHLLREQALKAARHFQIIGECNIQFALNPKNGESRVIEMNARLSRSSALASKATGYPLAFVAAKLALGKSLFEIRNNATKKTISFFEPALDYIALKIPKWDTHKLRSADRKIGTEMKSVGEVMAIGRSFPEALQKAIRMINFPGCSGISDYTQEIDDLKTEIAIPTDLRLFALYQFFQKGGSVKDAHNLSHIDPWFLDQLFTIVEMEKKIKSHPLNAKILKEAKRFGFSDKSIAGIYETDETVIRRFRIKHKIFPFIKQIDTSAGEFDAKTNYLYLTYHGVEHDITQSKKRPYIVLGSGPYSIGSSVEFDWCAVNAVQTLKNLKESTIIINSNPETVSTDYDESDRLYFEELTFERVQDIADFESPYFIILSFGGQIANNLAMPLYKAGYKILGSSPKSIDLAENREKFSSLLEKLKIDQPKWQKATSFESAKKFAEMVGYPLLIRPSYVLSGTAMNVIKTDEELKEFLLGATIISRDFPVVLSQFILEAKELEIDGVAEEGKIIIKAISEHIENAGVHSGDATLVLPPQRLYLETIRRANMITHQIAQALKITGPFNIQFIAKDNAIQVIECNLRASRSFPFVSKVTGYNFVEIAINAMLNKKMEKSFITLDLNYVGVKSPQFSYHRLKGSTPVAHVEMASTGEVGCIAHNLEEAFFLSFLASDREIKGKRLLVSIGGDKKTKLLEWLEKLDKLDWEIFATAGTHEFLSKHGVKSAILHKASENQEPNVSTIISNRMVDLIINIPTGNGLTTLTDGHRIRRLSIDHHIPLITNLQIAQLFLKCLLEINPENIPVKSYKEILKI